MLVSIVIPCYNSEKTIEKVVRMVMEEFQKMPKYECEFVLVNDNSKDNTFGQIRKLCREFTAVKGVQFMRNFGQHNALMAGLHYAKGDYVLGMDDDMQTHPSQIIRILDKMEEGYDLVYGYYGKKKNSIFKNLSSRLNQVSSRILLNRPKEIISSNFWVITKAVAREVIKYTSYNPYIDGIFYRTTHNIGNVLIEHHKREVGTSNYTFRKLLRLWLAYWNYSVIPLRVASVLGGVFSVIGAFAAITTVILKICTPDMVTGWASIMSAMTFFFGLVLMVLGIIGEYLGKLIMTINKTPQFIIRETINIEK